MKTVIKTIVATSLLGLVSIAHAEQPVLALSGSTNVVDAKQAFRGAREASRSPRANASASTFTIDFMAGDTAITALNFDIQVSAKTEAAVDLSQCISGLQAVGFVGKCAFTNGMVKVVGFSPNATGLATTTIGSITVRGSASIVADSVVMSDSNASAVQAEVL